LQGSRSWLGIQKGEEIAKQIFSGLVFKHE
jgi:hypothetical protein